MQLKTSSMRLKKGIHTGGKDQLLLFIGTLRECWSQFHLDHLTLEVDLLSLVIRHQLSTLIKHHELIYLLTQVSKHQYYCK